ncbi:hypothetical protein FHR92_001759 [Fontibacillus solani]|uniref:Uncharacterized protein n=1 Tax=Fontibacillus solani TaxID=1572857 RepID=A0A7W3XR92_9BACL|nr:hypothetical protein [Fontibacillus solani]MBA9085293.1 hypothetical protein [Fontibacillus solani]
MDNVPNQIVICQCLKLLNVDSARDALACLPTISTSHLTFMLQFYDYSAISTSHLMLMLQFYDPSAISTSHLTFMLQFDATPVHKCRKYISFVQ